MLLPSPVLPPRQKPSMVLIASEGVGPNLHALVHWSLEDAGLDEIHILHTENEQASLKPARRFHRLLQEAGGSPFDTIVWPLCTR